MNHNHKKNYLKLLFISSFIFLQACSPAMQEVESLLHYIHKTKEEIQRSPTEEKKQGIFTKARKRFLSIIDTELVAELSLGEYFTTLSNGARKEYINIFHELMAYNLVKTYIPIGEIAQENVTVELMYDEMRKDRVFNIDANIIHTRFSSNKVWYYIDFYLHKAGKNFKLYDVHVDGASVLLDYRVQFKKIIESRGFDYLLERLKVKFKELDQS